MIKLIASDMDGTLLNSKGNLPEDFDKVADKLINKGVVLVAASGRQYYTLKNTFSNIKDDMVFLAENGAYVVYKNKELYSSIISKEEVIKIIESSRGIPGVDIVLCGKNGAYIENTEERFLTEVKKYYHKYEVVESLLEAKDEFMKVSLFDSLGAAENSNKVMSPLWGEKYKVTVSGKDWLDLINKDANKGNSLKVIQKLLNIDKNETMVFGDYFNDVEMLQEAYHSYAMMNAPEGVKKHSRFLAKTNDEDGVMRVIKEKVLKEA